MEVVSDMICLERKRGKVGEGGDRMNVAFKNVGEEAVTIGGEEVVIVVTEEKDEEIKDDKPTLKLASYSPMGQPSVTLFIIICHYSRL